jgi:hypothetical protein
LLHMISILNQKSCWYKFEQLEIVEHGCWPWPNVEFVSMRNLSFYGSMCWKKYYGLTSAAFEFH